VARRAGLADVDPQPYWGFDDLSHNAGVKLTQCMHVQADVKVVDNQEYYWYKHAQTLEGFSFERMLTVLEQGDMLVDFDARTHHNHGTKFRLRHNARPLLYSLVTSIM
jgi:hypothetical protein